MEPKSWNQLQQELAAEIIRMKEGDTVILLSGERFVQMRQGADTLKAEAVSNRWLPTHLQLTPEDEREMVALGWQPPEPDLGFHNWRSSTEWPLRTQDAEQLSERLIATLRDVLDVSDPNLLDRRTFNANEEV
ncbi:TY-Chap domain-containing protein [Krasilnikovia sp. MM14-A1259]|uniref:TY-Chap domain-containing protein n=1 Tax=Krasilnikovia sp. MM14-A1259 TaxID=3373539 RepID=UPI0037F20BD2